MDDNILKLFIMLVRRNDKYRAATIRKQHQNLFYAGLYTKMTNTLGYQVISKIDQRNIVYSLKELHAELDSLNDQIDERLELIDISEVINHLNSINK